MKRSPLGSRKTILRSFLKLLTTSLQKQNFKSWLPKIVLVLIVSFLISLKIGWTNPLTPAQSYPELKLLSSQNLSFPELETFFKQTADLKGAEHAYAILRQAALPPGTDLHLLGHVVGDVLFKQQGADGIRICTQEFRNACSHSVVVGLFQDKGEAALPKIIDACRKAPGGSGAYTMCFHGLGHGILAYTGYDIPKTVEYCKKTGSDAFQNREYQECVGGAVMEIISGGGHDHDKWTKQNQAYLIPDKPLGLCLDRALIPSDAEQICLVYLTPFLFQAAGADLSKPTADNYEKAFTFCQAIDKAEHTNRDSCFGGFGKEFVVLSQNRDIRKIDQMNNQQLTQIYDWCRLAQVQDGTAACVIYSVNSIFWGGENGRSTPIRFCGLIADNYQRNTCFVNLIGAVFYYRTDVAYRNTFCQELSDPYRSDCQRRLNGQS